MQPARPPSMVLKSPLQMQKPQPHPTCNELIYAKRTAATAAAPTTTTELPSELAAPLKGVMGELLGCRPETLKWSVSHVLTRYYRQSSPIG